MTPVIQAHSGGLFCAGWTPEGGGLAYHHPDLWFDAELAND
jgi:hypothetical protein